MSSLEIPHSRLSASGAERWFACPGSIAQAANAPKKPSSIHAARGTAAHWVISETLKDPGGWSNPDFADHYLGVTAPNSITLDEEDIEAVKEFLNEVKRIRSDGVWLMYSEIQDELKEIHPWLGGTADVILVKSDFSHIIVMDYKHGVGVPVFVEKNKQAMIYLLIAIARVCREHTELSRDLLGWGAVFPKVTAKIIQPRSKFGYGGPQEWEVPALFLENFAHELGQRAIAASKPGADLVPGDHCKWCPAMEYFEHGELVQCKAFTNQRALITQSDFKAEPTLPDVSNMSLDDMVRATEFEDPMKDWFSRINEQLLAFALEGGQVPGHKVVRGTKHKAWADAKAARASLMKLFAERTFSKLMTPSQVLKNCQTPAQIKLVESLTVKPEGGLTLVKNTDRRKAVSVRTAQDDFTPIGVS